MARNVTLNELVERVRAESRISTANSRSVDNRSNVEQIIRRTQEELYDKYDWPHLKINKDDATKTLAAGQRYYDFPTDLNVERALSLWHKYGGIWTQLPQGVGPAEYSEQDSDTDERSDPAIKWDISDGQQFEIWPLPASDGGLVRFEGTRKLTPLIDENSRADIDDIVIVLSAAAEILMANNQKDAQVKLSRAADRIATLRGRLVSQKRLVFCGNQPRTGRETIIRVPKVSL